MPTNAPLISVVICTYNRAELVHDVLQTLCEQTLAVIQYEVIVVDNNSTDQTCAVVTTLCQNYPNIYYYLETRQGLSHARNRGWQVAHGEYVAYLDDDCKAPADWLLVAKEVIEQIAPGVFGGPFFAFYNTPKPHWFKDAYGSHEHGNKAKVLTKGEGLLTGGNIFIRRILLQTIDGFNTELGMSGERLAYGEETALQRHIQATMPDQQIYYEPRLYVYHLVRKEKLTLRWNIRARFANGRYHYRVVHGEAHVNRRLGLFFAMGHMLLVFLWAILYGVLFRDRIRYPYWENYLYEHMLSYIQQFGKLYEQWQITRNPQKTKLLESFSHD